MSEQVEGASASDEFERLKPAGDEAADLGRATRHAEQIEDGAVELRPRGVGEVLDLGLDLVRSRFGTCVALGALVWMPIQLITILLPQPDAASAADDYSAWMIRLLKYGLWVNVASGIGDLLVVGIVARIIGDAFERRRAGAGRALHAAMTRLSGLIVIVLFTYAPIIVVLILSALPALTQEWVMVFPVMLFGSCVAFVPALFMMWLFAPAPYVYVIEGVGLRRAIRRAAHLSCGRIFEWPSFFAFWRWARIVAVGALLVLPFSLLVAGSDYPSTRTWVMDRLHVSVPAYDALRVVIGGLFLAAATTVRAGYLTVYYLDCRVRREGLDLETWLARIRPKEKGSVPA